MVDKTLILRKLSEIDQYRKQLSEYSAITIKEYAKDWKVQRIVERTLQMMIEACLDVAGHIISDEEFRVPESYADMMRILYENDIINAPLENVLNKMAKFRNFIVHHYDNVDHTIVISILHKNLDDFERFKTAIVSYLKRKEKQNAVE